jgi:L-ascorbate metabolism protein UlaG (beta-lactamase superfamily)
MMLKQLIKTGMILGVAMSISACGSGAEKEEAPVQPEETAVAETAEPAAAETPAASDRLLYLGHASLRITTGDGKVLYVDPYAGNAYDAAADLILVTHDHYDHNNTDLVANRNPDCQIITAQDALAGGVHQSFDLGYAKVEAVEAGNNPNHSTAECVGYIITLSDGISIYVSGDTSRTEQMASLAEKQIDYAFFCCDGQYNMGPAEAAECADLVGAKHSIPYHVIVQDGVYFDRSRAEQFTASNRLILEEGEEIELAKS